jgi:hypothetical protein
MISTIPIDCKQGPVFLKVAMLPTWKKPVEATVDNVITDLINTHLMSYIDPSHSWTVELYGCNFCRLANKRKEVKIKKYGQGDHLAMSMAMIDGTTLHKASSIRLHELMKAVHEFTIRIAVAGHTYGLTHNDLHRSNVMIVSDPEPRFIMIDYGRLAFGSAFVLDHIDDIRTIARISESTSKMIFEFSETNKVLTLTDWKLGWLMDMMGFTVTTVVDVVQSTGLDLNEVIPFLDFQTASFISPVFDGPTDLMDRIEMFPPNLSTSLFMLVMFAIFLKCAEDLRPDLRSTDLLERSLCFKIQGRILMDAIINSGKFIPYLDVIEFACERSQMISMYEALIEQPLLQRKVHSSIPKITKYEGMGGSYNTLSELAESTVHSYVPYTDDDLAVPAGLFRTDLFEFDSDDSVDLSDIETTDVYAARGGSWNWYAQVITLLAITVTCSIIQN